MFSLPVEMRFQGGKLKYLAKETFKDLLPDFVLNYRKQGFEIPVGEWLREELKEQFLSLLNDDRKLLSELLDIGSVNNLFKQHLDKKADHSKVLWAIFTFLHWTNNNL